MNRSIRNTAVLAVASLASLSLVGAAQAAVVPVTQVSGDWATTGQAALTDYGVRFDASHWGSGNLKYSGFHGKLSDITRLTYTARYNTDAASGEGKDAPYLRIFFANGKDAIYDPSVPGNDQGSLTENVDHTRNVLKGDWRYDDDCGDGIFDSNQENGCSGAGEGGGYGWAGSPYSRLLAEHGNDEIAYIAVTAGWQFNENVEAVMSRMRVNGDEFNFGATGPKGDAGDQGQTGQAGADGTNGKDGSNGSNGADGALIVSGANNANSANSKDSVPSTTGDHIGAGKLVGASVRTLTAPTVKGGKLMSIKATLRGKKLSVKGNKITANLTGMSVGNYNVSIVAKFHKHGKTQTVRQTRSLSITLAP
jgi:hypothetical protein